MVTEVRVYAEGGGDGRDTKARIREGLRGFLDELVETGRSRGIRWSIVACGSRGSAYDAFRTALGAHGDSFNVLLVDAESPVTGAPWEHLQRRDSWDRLGADESQCHLMVQVMESWFLADIGALREYYGQGFNAKAIPEYKDVEAIEKTAVASALRRATRNTSKGEYHKIHHACDLLKRINSAKVRGAARHCDRPFTALTRVMTGQDG